MLETEAMQVQEETHMDFLEVQIIAVAVQAVVVVQTVMVVQTIAVAVENIMTVEKMGIVT